MLYQYTPWVQTYTKTTFTDTTIANDIYYQQICRNYDIFRDDVLYTYSSLLCNNTTKQKIEQKIARFDKYTLDCTLGLIDDPIYHGDITEQYTLNISVKGNAAEEQIFINSDQEVTEFSLDMKISVIKPNAIKFATQKAVEPLNDYYVVGISNGNNFTLINIKAEGYYKYKDASAQIHEVKDYKENVTTYPSNATDLPAIVFAQRLFFDIPTEAEMPPIPPNILSFPLELSYASHYFKDCTINSD